jgi:6-pyruvoyl-tetrahydropterin synthase
VRVEVAGPLTPDSYVLDFLVLKDIARTLSKQWDHRFLLPLRNPHLRITELEDAWDLEYAGPQAADFLTRTGQIRYRLPKWSVTPLQIDNATAERLAEQFAVRVVEQLRERGIGQRLEQITVSIEETPMQSASYTLDLRDLARHERSPDT